MKYKFKPSHIVPAFLFVVAVLYGGSKPSMPTNAPPLLGVGVRSRSTVESSNLHCTTTTSQLRLAHRLTQAGSLLRLATHRFSRCVPLPGRHQLHRRRNPVRVRRGKDQKGKRRLGAC